MTSVAQQRARSFDAWADDYDRYRPGYPAELFGVIADRLTLPARPDVADLGAGTGRAALAMARLGWRVTAVEPGEPMLGVLRARADEEGLAVTALTGTAEQTGLEPGSCDLAIAAQAFHWFDKPAALAEMGRIVRPRGGLALFWNVRDETRSPFVAAYHRLLDRYTDEAEGRYLQAGRATGRIATRNALTASPGFHDPELLEIHHELTIRPEEFIGMAFTASYIRALDPRRQDDLRRELRSLLDAHGIADDDPFAVPYRVDLWIARRADR
ncbi:MAG: methyltransferase domain-containing protein [Chloroflexota bacterium]|nr:methyltransferase domain-containing protein [Chloroflexota bacterium]